LEIQQVQIFLNSIRHKDQIRKEISEEPEFNNKKSIILKLDQIKEKLKI